MKRIKRILSPKHWLPYLRRQPLHMQHVVAVIFASLVTGLLASIILYVDYGFWHDRYVREDDATEERDTNIASKSPFQMFGSFLLDAKDRLSSVRSIGEEKLSGKEVYSSEEESVSSTTKIEAKPSE